jgi:hypothetical protein
MFHNSPHVENLLKFCSSKLANLSFASCNLGGTDGILSPTGLPDERRGIVLVFGSLPLHQTRGMKIWEEVDGQPTISRAD